MIDFLKLVLSFNIGWCLGDIFWDGKKSFFTRTVALLTLILWLYFLISKHIQFA